MAPASVAAPIDGSTHRMLIPDFRSSCQQKQNREARAETFAETYSIWLSGFRLPEPTVSQPVDMTAGHWLRPLPLNVSDELREAMQTSPRTFWCLDAVATVKLLKEEWLINHRLINSMARGPEVFSSRFR